MLTRRAPPAQGERPRGPPLLRRSTSGVIAMEYFDKQQNAEPPTAPAVSAALAEINEREGDIREQFKAGKLPAAVFKSWLAEFTKEREAFNGPAAPKSARFSRSEFLQEYKSAVARRLKVFTSRENVAMSREALCNVLADGRLALRPDVANGRFEGTLTLNHEEFLQEKQIDIKLVAGGRFELYSAYSIRVPAVPASASRRDETLCNVPRSRAPGEQAHKRPPASAG